MEQTTHEETEKEQRYTSLCHERMGKKIFKKRERKVVKFTKGDKSSDN